MRGRKPKSTQEKISTGNPGKRRLNTNEPDLPAPPDSFDEPPSELMGDERACAEWRRLAPQLRISRTVTEADRGGLLALCQQWSLYLEAKSKVQQLVVTSKSGHPMTNPFISVSNKALGHCIKLWAELGCTPSSRSRVTAVGDALPVDPLEAELSTYATH